MYVDRLIEQTKVNQNFIICSKCNGLLKHIILINNDFWANKYYIQNLDIQQLVLYVSVENKVKKLFNSNMKKTSFFSKCQPLLLPPPSTGQLDQTKQNLRHVYITQ